MAIYPWILLKCIFYLISLQSAVCKAMWESRGTWKRQGTWNSRGPLFSSSLGCCAQAVALGVPEKAKQEAKRQNEKQNKSQ